MNDSSSQSFECSVVVVQVNVDTKTYVADVVRANYIHSNITQFNYESDFCGEKCFFRRLLDMLGSVSLPACRRDL